MQGRRLLAFILAALGAIGLLAPAAAQATFHLMLIREVYSGAEGSSYVELQMYAAGQNLVSTHALTVYNASGAVLSTSTFSSNVTNSASQQTILIGGTGVHSKFGVTPDLVASGFEIPASGGAACWAGSVDCVSWGNFSGTTGSPAGTPADAAGIPANMALRRTIAPHCPTLLEGADDTNSSTGDFSDATPNPRNNSSPITETACVAPTAVIDSSPANPTRETSASFTYHSEPSGARFECSLDAAAFTACPSGGVNYAGPLADGAHSFELRAVNAANETSPVVTYGWSVDTTPPQVTIDTHPADPSPGASATFTFHANEAGATFECSLAPQGGVGSFSGCASGRTYANLANGLYTFAVRAIDAAGNVGAPQEFSWTVDNSIADTTPPETAILSQPPSTAEGSTAAFTYSSNEPGSSFECELDGSGFSPCPAGGVGYTSLAPGTHTFAVRAIDPSGNVDPTPAEAVFSLTAAAVEPPPVETISPPVAAPPRTNVTARPRARTRARRATVRFESSPGASFECRVDHAAFAPCGSPFRTRRLAPGRHLIQIRATLAGVVEATPARVAFRVLRGRRRH